MMEKNRVLVTIFGKEYSLVSEVDPDYIRKAAAYLDSKMREVSENYPNIPESRVAVLAALNIADELFRSRESIEGLPDQEQHLRELTRILSEVL
jgi:cell division protein ZapA